MNRKKLTKSLVMLLFLAATMGACGKKEAQSVPEAKVEHGTFYIDIYEEGEIEAINSINISSPNIPWRFGNLKISNIVTDGAQVKAGDTLIAFDPSEVRKAILDYEDRLIVSNHYEMNNTYSVYVYYRAPNDRYDRLVGYVRR